MIGILSMNNKGGVAKTTLALNVAAAWERLFTADVHGMDLDASQFAIGDLRYETGGSFLDWYHGRSPNSELRFQVERPAPTAPMSAEELLLLGGQHQVLVMDGPIALSHNTMQALIAADLVMVPVRPACFDVRATTNLFRPGVRADGTAGLSIIDLAAAKRAALGLPRPRVLLVPTFVQPDRRNRELRAVRAEAAALGLECLPVQMTQRLAYQRAQGLSESVLTVSARERDLRAEHEVKALAVMLYCAFRGESMAELEQRAARLEGGAEDVAASVM